MLNRLQDVFASLNSHGVRYLVIGGTAAVLHGVPRMTFDLDILIAPDEQNASRLLAALLAAGFGTAAMTNPAEVAAHEITVFQDRYRIDVLTKAPGIEFEASYARRVSMPHANVDLPVLSPEDVIASKLAAARAVDLEDAAVLQLLHRESQGA